MTLQIEPTAPPSPEPAPPEGPGQPNEVERAVAEIRQDRQAAGATPARRGRGRPKGSKTRRPTSSPPETPAPALEPPPPSEAEIAVTARLCAAGWKLAGSRLNRRPLEEGEARELAAAAIPVISKYAGDVAQKYGAEIALAVTVWGLWDATEIPESERPAPEGDTEPVSPTPPAPPPGPPLVLHEPLRGSRE